MQQCTTIQAVMALPYFVKSVASKQLLPLSGILQDHQHHPAASSSVLVVYHYHQYELKPQLLRVCRDVDDSIIHGAFVRGAAALAFLSICTDKC